jgi:hypothetical protein
VASCDFKAKMSAARTGITITTTSSSPQAPAPRTSAYRAPSILPGEWRRRRPCGCARGFKMLPQGVGGDGRGDKSAPLTFYIVGAGLPRRAGRGAGRIVPYLCDS